MHRSWKPKRERGDQRHHAVDVDGTPQIVGPGQLSRDLLDDDTVDDWQADSRSQQVFYGASTSAQDLRTVGTALSFRQPNSLARRNQKNIGRIGAATELALGTGDSSYITGAVHDSFIDLFGPVGWLEEASMHPPKTWDEIQAELRESEREFWQAFKGILGSKFKDLWQ